jgi:hypothetical protein
MTELLERAIKAMKELPPGEQDAIAALILEEIADEQAWDEAFARTQDKLGQIADKVRADIRTGRVRDGDWDELEIAGDGGLSSTLREASRVSPGSGQEELPTLEGEPVSSQPPIQADPCPGADLFGSSRVSMARSGHRGGRYHQAIPLLGSGSAHTRSTTGWLGKT